MLVPAIEKVFTNPEVVQRTAKLRIEVDYMGPAEFRAHLETQMKVAENVARETHMQKK